MIMAPVLGKIKQLLNKQYFAREMHAGEKFIGFVLFFDMSWDG